MENTQILEQAKGIPNQNNIPSAELTDDARNIAMALSLATRDESLRNDPEIQNLLKMVESSGKPAQSKPQVKNEAQETAGAQQQQEQSSEEKESVFFGKKDETIKADLSTPEGLKAYIKQNFNKEDIGEVFQDATKWKQEAEKVNEIQNNLTQVQDFLTGLPDPLYDAIEAFYHGRDWAAEANKANQKISFDKPFEQNSAQDIVDHYFPKQFTKDDFEDNGDMVQKAIGIAKRNFELDSERKKQEKENVSRDIQNRTKFVQASVDKSLSTLKSTFPTMSEGALGKVAKMMQTGDYKRLFMNDDGTFAPEAAKNIALALYGDAEIRRQERGKAVEESNGQLEKVLGRGADRVKPAGNGATAQQSNGSNDFMKFLGGYLPENNTYSVRTK